MFEVNIYLETSLKGPVTKDGWHAAVLEYITKDEKSETREDFERETSTTYHRQCLRALIKALKRLNASCCVNIYSDSVYVESGLINNLKRWKSNGFISADGNTLKNVDEWKEIAKLTSGHKIQFHRQKRNAYSSWMMERAKSYPFGCFESKNKAVKNIENTECER